MENNDSPQKNNLVKYDNDFVLSSSFNQLSSIQQDIFFSAVSFLCREKAEHIVIPANVIKARANLTEKKYSSAAYYKLLHGLEDVILKTIFTAHADGKEWKGALFDTFAIDEKNGDFEMFLNPHAAHYFFQIPGPFSQFELQVLLGLKSKYSKNLFRMLLAKYGGRWTPSADELVEVFALKNKGVLSAFTHRIPKYIDDIIKTEYFTEIKYTISRDATKPGRPLKLIEFTFKSNPKKKNELRTISRWWGIQDLTCDEKSYVMEEKRDDANDHTIPESEIKETKTVETGDLELKCPRCEAKYVKAHNSKTGTDFYGHEDYASSSCSFARKTFDTIEDLQQFISDESKKRHQEDIQKKKQQELIEKNPIAHAAQEAAADQKAYLNDIKSSPRSGAGLISISPAVLEILKNKDN